MVTGSLHPFSRLKMAHRLRAGESNKVFRLAATKSPGGVTVARGCDRDHRCCRLLRKPAKMQTRGPQPIAVLPLQNTSAAKDLDFLRLGLADDIATTLSYLPFAVDPPFAATSKYAGPDVDLQKAAQEMRVADMITGHFVVAGEDVEVTLEAVDAANNRVLWRDTLRGTARDLTGIQEQIAARVQHGLIRRTGGERWLQHFFEHIAQCRSV